MDFSLIPDAYAQGILPVIGGYDPLELVKKAIAWSFIIAGALCLVFIFVGGISFIISSGNDEKIKKAVSTIRYAFIGFIIVIIAFTAVSLVSRFFNIPFQFVDFRDIVNTVKSITSGLGAGDPVGGDFGDYYYDGGL